jgi:hypothetical protein
MDSSIGRFISPSLRDCCSDSIRRRIPRISYSAVTEIETKVGGRVRKDTKLRKEMVKLKEVVPCHILPSFK